LGPILHHLTKNFGFWSHGIQKMQLILNAYPLYYTLVILATQKCCATYLEACPTKEVLMGIQSLHALSWISWEKSMISIFLMLFWGCPMGSCDTYKLSEPDTDIAAKVVQLQRQFPPHFFPSIHMHKPHQFNSN
jgi:hypothetical protein